MSMRGDVDMSGEVDPPVDFLTRLQDPDYRDAFFNTTCAQLFADPDDESTARILAELERNSLAYMFMPDEFLAWPVLQSEFGQFVGEERIFRAIGRVIVPAVFPQTA